MTSILKAHSASAFVRLLTVAFTALIVSSAASIRPADAQTLTTVYVFPGTNPPVKGEGPLDGLAMDLAGNLYGTTQLGGATGQGAIFKITPSGVETVLHSFTGDDGAFPSPDLIRDSRGNLYGTASNGGSDGFGVIFRLDVSGNLTVLHNFACTDGSSPTTGLVMDLQGNLYGATAHGGTSCEGNDFGSGVVFRITPAGNFTILHTFAGGPTDGFFPFGPLLIDIGGNLYGTTVEGGASGFGTIFKVDRSGNETILHNFTMADGAFPGGRLLIDFAGNLFGTTSEGGASDSGTVFKLSRTGQFTVLHNFGAAANDGMFPTGGLAIDLLGNLFGTTATGGTSDDGTLFKIDRNGKETVLFNFTSPASSPNGDLIMDGRGNLYGTSFGDFGDTNYGTVFKFGSGAHSVAWGVTNRIEHLSSFAMLR